MVNTGTTEIIIAIVERNQVDVSDSPTAADFASEPPVRSRFAAHRCRPIQPPIPTDAEVDRLTVETVNGVFGESVNWIPFENDVAVAIESQIPRDRIDGLPLPRRRHVDRVIDFVLPFIENVTVSEDQHPRGIMILIEEQRTTVHANHPADVESIVEHAAENGE